MFIKITAKKQLKMMNMLIFSGIMIIMFTLSLMACAAEGKIIFVENGHGTGFTASFKDYTSTGKCELSLAAGDTVQVDIDHEYGKIMFAVSGKKGSAPYTGNNLESGIFTLTVPETDEYIFRIKGNGATGKITVRNLGQR